MPRIFEAPPGFVLNPDYLVPELEAQRDALLDAAQICLKAERERRTKLLPGAPATTYCERRIAMIEAAIKGVEKK